MEQHFQDVAQKGANNKNSDSFAAHFDEHFTQKASPQECREIMSFDVLSTVNPIGYTIYYILYPIYYMLYTIYYILYTLYYVLYTIFYELYIIY